MADISILSRLINGVQRNVDISANTLVTSSIKVGGGSGTELTKTILDNLIILQNGSDATTLHNHDGAYYTKAQVYTKTETDDAIDAAVTAATPDAADVSFTPAGSVAATDVQAAIVEVSGDADAAQADATQALSDAASAQATADAAIPATEKGANNGVATLDGGGKIPVAQLPSAVMTYEGTWNATTNTPTLANGTGDAGMVYLTSVAGTVDFGAGNIAFAVGDWAVYNGSIWQKSLNSNAVVSVNGQTGVVSLTTTNIAEGTNLYFTAAAAQAATISQVITNGVTTKAPSEDAVFDALALKQAASANLDEADTFFGATNLTGAEAEQLSDGSNADSLHSHSLVKETLVAGEAMAATTLFAVRFAKAADAGFVAGRAYKAHKDASSADNFYVVGLARPASLLAAGDPLPTVKSGLINVPSHGFTVGAPLYLSSSGAVTATAPSATNEAVVRVGIVRDANNIEVQIQVMGVN